MRWAISTVQHLDHNRGAGEKDQTLESSRVKVGGLNMRGQRTPAGNEVSCLGN